MQARPPMQHSIVCIALQETTAGKFTVIRAGIFTREHKEYSNFSPEDLLRR